MIVSFRKPTSRPFREHPLDDLVKAMGVTGTREPRVALSAEINKLANAIIDRPTEGCLVTCG
jgi:hypothetical protein